MTNAPVLPILDFADRIRDAVHAHGRLVLVAPPGTGKSTQVPRLLMPEAGQAVVLQPRRVAARALASRVAAEHGTPLGETIGYQVRFERAKSERTRVLFATYGVFWQQLTQAPDAPGVSLVILDEFHERSLEADACLAWLTRLQRTTRPDLRLVVMSATLESETLVEYLDAPLLRVTATSHPVTIAHQAPRPQEPVWNQAARGFRHLLSEGLHGSVLVFMPGVGEIRRTSEALAPIAETHGYQVLELSGAQSADAQQRALSEPATRPCVIVSTNVAETSLTIPGVSAVIDSGLSRQAAYDAERDLDTLHLGYISQQNATQRAGRAGRLGPGRCLRLWPLSLDSSLVAALPPEIARLDLARLALDVAALPEAPRWLTPPPPERWALAQSQLARLGALGADGKLNGLGRKLLRLPIAPALARALLAGQEAGYATLIAAMIAVLETVDRKAIADEGDLYLIGLDLAREPEARQWSRDTRETFKQLLRLAKPPRADEAASQARHPFDSAEERSRREAVTRAWLAGYSHRLAFRHEKAYRLADGRNGTVSAGSPQSPLLIALELREVGGAGKNRQVGIPLFLPCEADWVEQATESTIVCGWDAGRERVVQERHFLSNGLTLRKEPLPSGEWDWEAAEHLLVEKLMAGEITLEAIDEEVEQWLLRLKLAAAAWPEMNLPRFDAEDWRLLYHELVRGKSGPGDVGKGQLLELLREYAGWAAVERLERTAPRTFRLPSGKQARITYFEDAPPELSARLGDMLGLEGTLKVFDGRVPVLFDILAPNFRTVQKTFDMTGFWKNTYPEVKKELKRRYPKHPWP